MRLDTHPVFQGFKKISFAAKRAGKNIGAKFTVQKRATVVKSVKRAKGTQGKVYS